MLAAAAPGLVERWARLYADSKALSAFLMFVHLGGVLLAGGFAIAADRASLLLPREPADEVLREIARLKTVHVWVLGGLGLTIATGGLQFLSDVGTYLTAWLFWVKMFLIAVLLVNGWVRLGAERAMEAGAVAPHLARFKRTSVASLVLWFAVLLAGAFLTTVS
jgi:hypothetical protein